MHFNIKKLSKKVPKSAKPKALPRIPGQKIIFRLPILISIAIILILCIGIVKALSNLDMSVFLEIAGNDLQEDAYGHTNFLILGTADDENEGTFLTDTMIVASLDPEKKLVTMVSIPRDYYVHSDEMDYLKINEIYLYAKVYFGNSTEALEHLKSKVEEITGIPIHYWALINFQGFKDLIDALGGVDVEVKNDIYDPYYPKDGTVYYETFKISAGLHHMDGETALKFARSRQTTSDFDRAGRQQQLIYAMKEKALSTEVLLSSAKIKNILTALKSNIETNITVKEILTMGSMAKNFSEDNLLHRLIHDDPNNCGGLVYTPMREFYNNKFVLIPAGDEEYIHRYTDLSLNHPEIAKEKSRIHVLNGTETPGIAGETKQILRRYCFEVNRFGNGRALNLTQTTYFYKQKYDEKGNPVPSRPVALDFLTKIIPGVESTEIPEEYKEYMLETDIILEIGSDYTTSPNYIDDPFYYLPDPYIPKKAVETTVETPEANANQ
ncbi:MAG: LCP family protein [Candidatus Peregrinibacteria bacterium]